MIRKLNEKIESINKKWELLIVIALSFFMVFGVVVGIGTLTSGYHLVDDHQILEWTYQMEREGQSVWEVISRELANDFTIRFRPLYIITHILKVKLFGINLTYHALVKALEVVISCIFLYYSGRLMGANKVSSFLFAALSLLGYQSPAWWKLGTHEIQGTMLLAVGWYCMLKWLGKKEKKWAVASMIAFFLMCNYKESYVLLAPFLMLYVVYDEMKKRELKFSFKGLWTCVKANIGYLIAMGIVFVIPLVIITFFVGVNKYDKVGLDASVPLQMYWDALKDAFATDLKWYVRFTPLFVMVLLTYWDELKKLWKEILLTAAFLLPQFVIYGQTGINERYILPSSIGFAFFFVIVILNWKPLSAKRRAVYVLGLLLLLAAHGRVTLREADYFRYRGEGVTTMLESVMEMSAGKNNVLSCFRPNEEGNLTINYWMKVHGYDNVYYWTEEDGIINQVCDSNFVYRYSEEQQKEQSFNDMDIVVMYNKEDRHWCYEPSLDLSDFTEIICGTLNIYVRNGCGIEVPQISVEGLRINF